MLTCKWISSNDDFIWCLSNCAGPKRRACNSFVWMYYQIYQHSYSVHLITLRKNMWLHIGKIPPNAVAVYEKTCNRTSEAFLHYVQVRRECQVPPEAVWTVVRFLAPAEYPFSTFFMPQAAGHHTYKMYFKMWTTKSSLFQHATKLICWFCWVWLETSRKN